MSPQLILLTLFMAGLGCMALIKPATLFEYPVAASLLMLAFILPQAWQIESTGEGFDYNPSNAWGYMILCMVMLVIGFKATSRPRDRGTLTPQQSLETLLQNYHVDRLFKSCVALVGLGAVAWALMMREAATGDQGAAWTGVITFYALLTGLLLYGASISWLLYLYTRSRKTLLLAVFGMSFLLPSLLFTARREIAFALGTSFLLGLFFVRGKSISRAFLIPIILVGAVYINQAGKIREYIKVNDTTLVSALASDKVTDMSSGISTDEVMFAISDIALTEWGNDYAFFTPYWNALTHLYFPAFIFGRDAKNALQVDYDSYAVDHPYVAANGATHTGFGDSFIEFQYFGCLLFFAIAAVLGYFWRRAREGDIGAQLYYMLLLTEGMMTITESTARFVGKIPFLFGTVSLVFWYARKPRTSAVAALTDAAPSVAAHRDRSSTRLLAER